MNFPNMGPIITTINVRVNIRENATKKSMLLILQFIIDGGSQPNLWKYNLKRKKVSALLKKKSSCIRKPFLKGILHFNNKKNQKELCQEILPLSSLMPPNEWLCNVEPNVFLRILFKEDTM